VIACQPGTANTYPVQLCTAPIATVRDVRGFWNRECGSAAAFWAAADGRFVPYQRYDNVTGWALNEIPSSWLDSTPQPGDILIHFRAGGPGHAAYVIAVNDGTVEVKQYNYADQGEFSEMTLADTYASEFITLPARGSTAAEAYEARRHSPRLPHGGPVAS
jgi:surface antigen